MIKTFVRPTAEIMSRLLTEEIQKAIDDRFCPANWTRGKLILMSVVLKRFQKFWRRHGDCLPERRSDLAGLKYGEAAFAFSLLAYLQKALSGVALARSDFSEGRGAMDICVVFHEKKYLIEIKLKDKSLEKSRAQLAERLEASGEKEGWLVVFDRSRRKSRKKKRYWRTFQLKGAAIHVVGC